MSAKQQCLVFNLPSGAGGMAAGMYRGQLIKQLNHFLAKHKIDFVSKTQRYTFKVWFNEPSHYTFFLLGFDWSGLWSRPYLADENYEP